MEAERGGRDFCVFVHLGDYHTNRLLYVELSLLFQGKPNLVMVNNISDACMHLGFNCFSEDIFVLFSFSGPAFTESSLLSWNSLCSPGYM